MKMRFIFSIAICLCLAIFVGALLFRVSGANRLERDSKRAKEETVSVSKVEKPLGVVKRDRLTRENPPQTGRPLAGQTTTLLAYGRSLLIGGESEDGPRADVEIRDARTGVSSRLPNGLRQARAWHSATTLPDGKAIILGGVDRKGQLVDVAELFDSETQKFETLPSTGLTPRAYHTATLLTDGHVLVVGGLSRGNEANTKVELFDPQTRTGIVLPTSLQTPRKKHTASILPDGNVLIWGGIDQSGTNVDSGEIFDIERQSFSWAGDYARQIDPSAPYLTASSPKDGETSVPKDTRIALRFSKPLRLETVNAETATLTGPEGRVAVKVVPAENGMLAFVTPREPLLTGSMYSLSLVGATDKDHAPVPPTTLTFMTIGTETIEHVPHMHDHQKMVDNKPPEFDNLAPGERADDRWRAMLPLQAEPGVTALAGQVLKVNGQPLPNVTLQIEERAVRTDSTGRFLLTSIPSGHLEMLVNGVTASRPGKLYATCENGVDVVAGQTTVLPYTIWLPVVDTQHATDIPVPTTREIVATNPLLPGLEMHIPAGVRLRTHDGSYLTSMALTPVPLDRTPIPLPPGTFYYFTPQAHDSVVETADGRPSPGIRIIYPNVSHLPPGAKVDLYDYITQHGWYVYGQGTVTPNGSQIVPDPGVGLQRLTCNNSMANPYAPGVGPAAGNGTSDGDPVDLGTGLFVYRKTDLVLPDTIPITLTRTYRQNDPAARAFGIGATHPYEMYLRFGFWASVELILPDGGNIHYDEVSPGAFVYQHTATPTKFYKSTLTRNPDGNYDLKLLDGTTYHFFSVSVCCNQLTHVYLTGLVWIQDRYGNRLTVDRDSDRRITKLVSPNGRWVSFTYNGSGQITQAQDSAGRTVSYGYDPGLRLAQVTDVNGGITQYTYDGSGRMLTPRDARQIVYLTNEYDSNGRVQRQTQADTGVYQFAYTVDGNGKVTQTDVTNPRGFVRRATFSPSGYTLTDTFALGRPEQQTYTYERQANTNLILSVTDPLGRSTALTYDAQGNVITVTRLAGTPDAVTANCTYEPTYNQIASATDPLNHTASFAYDSSGNLTSVTDPLNHQVTFTYNSAGQVLTATDPLQRTIQFGYDSGDLTAITDPLNRTVTRYIDAAGRMTRVTNPLGAVTRYEYDALNQIIRGTDPLQGVTALAHDPNGNVLSITDARNSVTSYVYDQMDRVTTRRDPLLHDETYQYDVNGNVSQVTDRKGQVTTFTYDALDRLTQVAYADTSTTSYTYDSVNRLTQVVDSLSGTITYGYDNLDRVTSETTSQGSVSYTYDAAGRPTSMTVAGQPIVNYSYDNANRLTQITQGSSTVTIAYDDGGRRTSLTLPNGVVTEYGYDLASHLTSLTYKQGGNVIGDLTYEYDTNGRRTRMGGSFARSITPPTLASANYNGVNQQLTFGSQTFSYDLNGNLLSDGQNSYIWDARNQLSSVSGLGVSGSFQYDAAGRRSSKTVNGTSTSFLYDGANIVQEQSSQSGNANMLNGGLDELFARTDGTGRWSPLADGLGSSLSLTDSAGTAQTEYTYGAFGQAATTGASNGNSSQYTNRENDSTGLYYNRARYYSPALQRFISEDPIGLAGGNNLYAYVGNNPINFSDPSGLQTGPVNSFRDPFSADHWILNGGSNTISDMLMLDHFAGWAWVAGDHCRPASERAWAGGKILGAAALLAGGGQIMKGAGRALGAGAELLGRGGGALEGASEAAFKGAGAAGDFSVSAKHLPGSAGRWAKFAEGVDPSKLITDALSSSNASFHPNTIDGAFNVITDLGTTVGSKGQTTIKVVVGWDGTIWTAYPVH